MTREQALEWYARHEPAALYLTRSWAIRCKVARQYDDDLYQAARIGLWEAARKLDSTLDRRQQAVYWKRIVLGRLIDHVRSHNGLIHQPRSVRHRPRVVHFSAFAPILASEIRFGSARIRRYANDLIEDLCGAAEDPLPRGLQRDDFFALLRVLPPDHREIFWLRYGEHQTVYQIAPRFGLSVSRVDQIFRDDLKRLRDYTPTRLAAVGVA